MTQKGKRREIYFAIEEERLLQNERYGGAEHDDEHSTKEFCSYIRKHNKRAHDETGMDQRYQLIRVAALAVAAVESFDRKNRI